MSSPAPGPRVISRPAVSATLVLIAVVSATALALADTPPAPDQAVAPGGSLARTDPSPAPSVALFPLPAELVTLPPGISTASLPPTSSPGVPVGQPIPFRLGHCGLHSPVDIDGSLWQAVSGHDAAGGPIEGDAETVELINEAEGLLTIVTADRAEFRTWASTLIVLRRAPGEVEYPLCM
jgi:hypothetical protein